MQEIWESYMKPIDGRPASVAFNAEVSERLPDEVLGVAGFVKVALRAPTPEGFIGETEADDIAAMEDRLELEALRFRAGKYIGRIVSAGEVHFVFYLHSGFEWADVTATALAGFAGYDYTSGTRPDSGWEVYRKLLYPTGREWQMIHNHHACDRLKAAGDNLRLPRAIEHRSYFPTAERRDAFVTRIEAEGFRVQKTVGPTEQTPLFGLHFYRIDSPYYYDIDALTLILIELGEHLDGIYDGWETSLVKM